MTKAKEMHEFDVTEMESYFQEEFKKREEHLKLLKQTLDLLQKEQELAEELNRAISANSMYAGKDIVKPLDIGNLKKNPIVDQIRERTRELGEAVGAIATDVNSKLEASSKNLISLPKLLDDIHNRIENFPKSMHDTFDKVKKDVEDMIEKSKVNTSGKSHIEFLNDLLTGGGQNREGHFNKLKEINGFKEVQKALSGVKVLEDLRKGAHESLVNQKKKLASSILDIDKKLKDVAEELHQLENTHKIVSNFHANGKPDISKLNHELDHNKQVDLKLAVCFHELKLLEKLRLPSPIKEDPVMDNYLARRKNDILAILAIENETLQLKELDNLTDKLKTMRSSLNGNVEINAALKAADKLLKKKAFYTTKVKDKYNMIIDSISNLDLEDRGKVLTGDANPVSKALGAKRGFFSIKAAPVDKTGKIVLGKAAKSLNQALKELNTDLSIVTYKGKK